MHSFSLISRNDGAPVAGAAREITRFLWGSAQRMLMALLRWQELARQRQALLALDDRLLKDIGLSRADAVREARRPFWDDLLVREQRNASGRQRRTHSSSVPCRQL